MSEQSLTIAKLMELSGVKFGTSGARGRVTEMTDQVCYAYTCGFLQALQQQQVLANQSAVGIAGDYRPSTQRIMQAVAQAIVDLGYQPRNFGYIPTPALAYYGMQQKIPTLMVTGSHIPDDRNGIKFNTAQGEILKADEEMIRQQVLRHSKSCFDVCGALCQPNSLPAVDPAAEQAYLDRYLGFFPSDALAGFKIGLYGHSSVARQPFEQILTGLGAKVDRLGYSETFIPVDTEAIRPEDVQLARDWASAGQFDALVSADGDGDRPLISDEHGNWLRGDIAGVLCAHYLQATAVVTPVSSSTVLEKSGWFKETRRSRIGSPFVIEQMQQLLAAGSPSVVGYEANGGFLLASSIERDGRLLAALPTRDAVLVVISILLLARSQQMTISQLLTQLPQRFTYSDRIKDFPTTLSQERLAQLTTGGSSAIDAIFASLFGKLAALDLTDGVRMTFENSEIAHLRPSGNAPELRAYTEANTEQRAEEMNRLCLEILASWREQA